MGLECKENTYVLARWLSEQRLLTSTLIKFDGGKRVPTTRGCPLPRSMLYIFRCAHTYTNMFKCENKCKYINKDICKLPVCKWENMKLE